MMSALPETAPEPTPPHPAGKGQLLRNIVHFARLLRALGMDVTPTQILDLVAALEHMDLGAKQDVKAAARAILVGRREHLELFDEAFELFWRAHRHRFPRVDLGQILRKRPAPQELLRMAGPPSKGKGQEPEPDPEPELDKIFTWSDTEILRRKDFARMSEYELAQVKALMEEMRWDLDTRRSRRLERARTGAQLDLRRTFRRNTRYGGELLELAWRQRKEKRRPIVALCDISGSMDRYSRVLLQFLYAITHSLGRVEAFVFGTRLTRITRQLRIRDIDQAVDAAASQVEDWAGGTRIGEALRSFNRHWARRVLGQGAMVLIISDGWDRGDPELLGQEMDRLHRSCHRLIWLNPLLGSPGYEPLTRGIQAALPHVDEFLPVHNLVSLEQLAQVLRGDAPRRHGWRVRPRRTG